MKEKNKKILKKTIKHLPVYKPGDEIWEQIHGTLDKRKGYQKVITSLPVFEAPFGVWENIESKLHQRTNKNHFRSWFLRSAAAALILLGIGTAMYFIVNRKPMKPEQQQSLSGTTDPFIFNPALCEGNPQICNSPVFIELDKQLRDVKKELDILYPMVDHKDPQILKYYYRMENLRVEIEKKMVKLIIES